MEVVRSLVSFSILKLVFKNRWVLFYVLIIKRIRFNLGPILKHWFHLHLLYSVDALDMLEVLSHD